MKRHIFLREVSKIFRNIFIKSDLHSNGHHGQLTGPLCETLCGGDVDRKSIFLVEIKTVYVASS
jgi:hypothetical protein